MAKKLFELNPALDRATLAEEFAANTRVHVRDFLTQETASEIRDILSKSTPWGLAMQADGSAFEGPQQILPQDLRSAEGQQRAQAIGQATDAAGGRPMRRAGAATMPSALRNTPSCRRCKKAGTKTVRMNCCSSISTRPNSCSWPATSRVRAIW